MVRITENLIRKRSEHNECLLSTLEEVAMHQEDIERIEHIQNWCRYLKILLLQSNLISKIENLHKLKRLEYLNLAMNNIERIENLEGLESLNKLDLTLNFIGELTSIESLRENYNLKELILTGNPCCDFPNYREYVIATLPQLESFDCEEIKNTDRLIAKRNLDKNRAVIIQRQANYAIERDEQKIRYQQHKEELESQMEQLDDEDDEERKKLFWQTKCENCPEIRVDIANFHRKCREPTECKMEKERKELERKRPPQLFAADGRPYNLNQAKLSFVFKDERAEFILELSVYKYLETSQIEVDVQPNYIRVVVKGKIFQLSLSEEVKIDESIVQRSQTTGALLVRIPKLHYNEPLTPAVKKDMKNSNSTSKGKGSTELKGPVNIRNICANPVEQIPDLI